MEADRRQNQWIKDRRTKLYSLKKKIQEKWTESKEPWGQPSIYTSWESQEKREERVGKNIWRNNGQTLPKFNDRHESIHQKCLTNSKKDKLKEIYTKTYYNQTTKIQRENLKAARKKWLIIYKSSSIRLTGIFHQIPGKQTVEPLNSFRR